MKKTLSEGTSRQPTDHTTMKLREQDDPEFEVLGAAVRVGVLIWSAAILTLNYVSIPGLPAQRQIDPTFIASIFTGALATFGIQRTNSASSNSSSNPQNFPTEQSAPRPEPPAGRPVVRSTTKPSKPKADDE